MSNPLILMYHGFGERSREEDPSNLFVTEEALDHQLRRLLSRGYRPMNEAQYLAGLNRETWPVRSFLVTIDDGYVSTLSVAAPVLYQLGVPAILFALPGLLGGNSNWMPEMPYEPLLDASGLRELEQWGVRIGVHGLDHTSLAGGGETFLRRQTLNARELLAEALGYWPLTFAYPFGHHDLSARRAVEAAGFVAAFAVYAGAGRFALPRVDINSLDTARTFALKTSGLYPTAKAVLDRLPAVRRLGHSLVGKASR